MAERGWIIPEEIIDRVLADGLSLVRQKAQQGTLAEFVSRAYFNLTVDQQASIVQWLSEHTMRIVHGFPLEHQEFPCWAIILDPEENSQQYIGQADEDLQLETGEHVVVTTERWAASIGVVTYSENVDLVRWLYQLAKFLLSAQRVQLSVFFPYRQQLSGRDLQPVQHAGRFVYRRALSCNVEYDQLDYDPDVPAIDQVNGDAQADYAKVEVDRNTMELLNRL